MKNIALHGLVALALSFASAARADSTPADVQCQICAREPASATTPALLAPFPASGVNPNPANPDPNSRLGSAYHLDAANGELSVEGGAARIIVWGFYDVSPWAAVREWIGLNGKLVVGTEGFACVGDPGFKSHVRCMNHQRTVTDDLANLDPGKERAESSMHAANALLGRLRGIPNAADTHYLIDSLVTTTGTSSSFVLESINCDADTAHERYSCTLRSSTFKK